mgnify:FL=1
MAWARVGGKTLSGAGANANPDNNVGWAWCLEPGIGSPYRSTWLYAQKNAEKLKVDARYRDAVIAVARKMQSAVANNDVAAASTYRAYLIPFVARDETSKQRAAATITEKDPKYTNAEGKDNFPEYKGTYDEFKQLTGYQFKNQLHGGISAQLEKAPGVTIPCLLYTSPSPRD